MDLLAPLAHLGASTEISALLAEESLHGVVTTVFEDSQWDPKIAVSAFQKLASVQGIKVFHVMGAGMSLAIKPISERQNLLLFSAAANPELLSNSSNVIRHSNEAGNDARILAEALLAKSPKRVASLYVENEWGEFFNASLAEAVQRTRNTVFVAEPYLTTDSDFRDRLLRLIGHQPDIFVVNSFGAAAGMIIKQLRQLGFQGSIFANNGFVLSNDSITALGDLPMTDFYFQDYPELPLEFCQLYFTHYNKKPGYLALAAYTDIELLGYAASKVGNSPAAVAKFIRSLKHFRGKYESIDISPEGGITVETIVKKWSKEDYNKRMHPDCRGVALQSGDS